MIVFEKKNMGNAAHKSQHDAMMSERKVYNRSQELVINNYGNDILPEELVLNERGLFDPLFWAEIDRAALEVRDNDQGREFVTDLMGIATPLHIGKTVKAYTVGGDIDDEVKRSIDGQEEVGYEHNENTTDGDPVPIFQAGFGINWREWEGKQTMNIEAVADAQRLKMGKVMSNVADYILDGDDKIAVAGKKAQGIRNHRNTKKIDLTIAGVDLTSFATSNDDIMKFWTQTLPLHLDANYVDTLDVAWVSPEIARRMQVPYSNAGDFKEGTLMEYVMKYGRVKSFRRTFKMSGNEWFGYVRNKDVITPLVGAALSTVPIPRTRPRQNFNFEIWGALGIQIKADTNGRGSVFYAAALT